MVEASQPEDEVLSGTDYTENRAEEMSKRHDHSKNLIGTPVIPACRQVIDSASVRCFGDRQGKPDRPAAEKWVGDHLAQEQKYVDELLAVKGPRTIENCVS